MPYRSPSNSQASADVTGTCSPDRPSATSSASPRAARAAGINGDGIADLIVSAAGAGDDRGGAAYVVFGRRGAGPAAIGPRDLDGSNGFTFVGRPNDLLGRAISGAGDVNGDGYDDILIGTRYADTAQPATGAAHVMFGGPGRKPAAITPDDLDGNNGFAILGADTYDALGDAVGGGGDVNGDGLAEIVVSALFADPGGGERAGQVDVIDGRTGGLMATIDPAVPDAIRDLILNGASPGGGTRSAGAGATGSWAAPGTTRCAAAVAGTS